jgi:two-component system, LytTR family, response regulator
MTPEKKYTCILVDDKELDRMVLQSYLGEYSFLEVIGAFSSARQALEFLQTTSPPDVLFLDIDMPGMNGLTLRSRLEKIPACVFVTGHPEFAVESFEMAALDYLLKPLKADRVAKMMQRLEEFLTIHSKAHLLDHTLNENTLFIKDGYHQVKLQMQEIVYLEALKDYTGIITKEKKYCVLAPLGTLLKEKTFQQFIRIHRSYAIHRHSVREISSKGVWVNDVMVPVGRSYKETVEKLFSA